jgi:glycerol transport system permease protein
MIIKTENNKAWWLVLPVFLLVAFSAVIPLMTVVNYSVQDIFDQNNAYFVGVDWYREVLRDPRLHDSLLRQFIYSFSVLAIEIPLGIGVALMMPTKGRMGSLCLILLAIPLLIPWNVVGTIWQIFGRADIGLFGWALNALGIDYNYASNTGDAWATVLLMDVWHWTSLVALLCYSGLRAIPEAFYQAAEIDRASKWAVFRYIQLPRLKSVLVIGILLRFIIVGSCDDGVS